MKSPFHIELSVIFIVHHLPYKQASTLNVRIDITNLWSNYVFYMNFPYQLVEHKSKPFWHIQKR